MMEGIESPGLDSSDSLSLPSEPPDIRNWFSSYVYESFPLDTNDYMKDSLNKGNECSKGQFCDEEGNREDSEATAEENESTTEFGSSEDGWQKNPRIDKISDYLLSPSFPSEPPDVGNWFSSYVHESPVLDTDGLTVSLPRESECQKDGFGAQDSSKDKVRISEEQRKDESRDKEVTEKTTCSREPTEFNDSPPDIKHEAKSPAKALDSPQSLSLLSELPDVRNWFSSYVYESPVISDTNDSAYCSSEQDGFVIDDSDAEEEMSCGIIRKTASKHGAVPGNKLFSDGCKGNISISVDDKTSKEKEIKAFPSLVATRFEQNVEYQSLARTCRGSTSTKEVQASSLNYEAYSLCEPKDDSADMNIEKDVKDKSLPRTRSRSTKEIQEPSLNGGVWRLTKEPFQVPITALANGSKCLKKAALCNCNKENAQENGFVTTRNDRFREESRHQNSTRKLQVVLVECPTSKGSVRAAGEKEDTKAKRKVLVDRTNLQHEDVIEMTGKWQCPQKNKQDKGPPFKQLRLDRWVNKVVK